MVDFIKGEWYHCIGNNHLYQFDKIENNRFIASAWIHRGSFGGGYLTNPINTIPVKYFNSSNKVNTEIVNIYLPKTTIHELW